MPILVETSNAVRTLIGLVLTISSNTEAPDGILATGMEMFTTPRLFELLTPALLNGDIAADPYELADADDDADDDDDGISEDIAATGSSTVLSTALVLASVVALALACAVALAGDRNFEFDVEFPDASPFKISVVWTRKKPSTTGNNLERRDMRVDCGLLVFSVFPSSSSSMYAFNSVSTLCKEDQAGAS